MNEKLFMNKIMNCFSNYNNKLRYTLLILSGLSIVYSFRKHWFIILILLSLDMFLVLYEYLTHRDERKTEYEKQSLGLCMGICIIICAMNWSNSFALIYYFFLLHNIFHLEKGEVNKLLLIAHFIGIIFANQISLIVFDRRPELSNLYSKAGNMLFFVLIYSLVLFIMAIIHFYKFEMEKFKLLNNELVEYSFKEREYLIDKERSNISQELHDSLGNSLMAILMNIRYLKALKDKTSTTIENEIDEIEKMVKESTNVLRTSVYSLKKLDGDINLIEEIEEIIYKFDNLNMIKINLSYDKEIEILSNRIKHIFYKIIREGITNSLKHGNSTKIDIAFKIEEEKVVLVISDNGVGCDYINKSNGLNGILERIKVVEGEVNFISARNKGFTIRISITREEEF